MVFADIQQIVDIVKDKLAGHQPQPSLLHGDLWPANCAITQNLEGCCMTPHVIGVIGSVILRCCHYIQIFRSKLLMATKVFGHCPMVFK